MPSSDVLRLGVVSYLNTLPLIDGLERLVDVELRPSVPSRLVDALVADEVDLALCSSIDYQRSPAPLVIVPCGMLGCRGPTLTVRLCSAIPLHEIELVHADTDSHTSVALLSLLFQERFGRMPEIVPFDARGEDFAAPRPESVLLIGDKVVTAAPRAVEHPYQLDLGAAWFEWTRLPFVFAVWMARADSSPQRVADAAAILERQRLHNRERFPALIHRHATRLGWPRDLAERYLNDCLRFDFDAEAARGLAHFHMLASLRGLVPARRPLEYAGVASALA